MTKKLVFIHGSDPKQANTPWMFFHLHPSNYNSNAPVSNEGRTFDLVYFDFQMGTLTTWENWSAARAQKPPSAEPNATIETLVPWVSVRNQQGVFYKDKPEYPSVLAFYDWVKKQKEKSIASIQIFSHGVIHQPVLWPFSYEWGDVEKNRENPNAERDEYDTEFRLRDFNGRNPLSSDPPPSGGESELEKFHAALAKDVFIKVWGCAEQRYSHDDGWEIRKLVTDYRKVEAGRKGDKERDRLRNNYLKIVKEEFLPYKLAKHLNVPVWACPVGYGTDWTEHDGEPERGVDGQPITPPDYTWDGRFPPNLTNRQWWWRVEPVFRQHKADKFFRDVLGAKVDPLGYVEYRSDWVESQAGS